MSNDTNSGCSCGCAPKLIFACSGAADVGEVADHVARQLAREGVGKMYCLAGVGGHIEDMVLNVQAAGKILAIDGCPKDCARKTLEHAGFSNVTHIRLTDMGLQKGASPATEERVGEVVNRAKPLFMC